MYPYLIQFNYILVHFKFHLKLQHLLLIAIYRCRDEFELKSTSAGFQLHIPFSNRILNQNEFCVNVVEDFSLQPEICRELKTNHKFK